MASHLGEGRGDGEGGRGGSFQKQNLKTFSVVSLSSRILTLKRWCMVWQHQNHPPSLLAVQNLRNPGVRIFTSRGALWAHLEKWKHFSRTHRVAEIVHQVSAHPE